MLAVFKPDALHAWDQTLESHLLDECVNHYTVDQLLPVDLNYGPVGATAGLKECLTQLEVRAVAWTFQKCWCLISM